MSEDQRKPLDIPLFLASQIILVIVTTPAFIPRPAQIIAFVVLGWYFYQVIFTQTTGDFSSGLGIGSAIVAQYVVALDYALLTPPEGLKDLHDKDPTRVTRRPFKERALWALKLFSNPRSIGWAHEPSHLPARPSHLTPHSRFVFTRILLATCCSLVVGGTHLFLAAFADMVVAEGNLLTGAPLHQRAVGVLLFGLGGICTISGLNAFLSAVLVGFGHSSPERWPLLFGSPLELWSIRRFWRRFWHQMVRRSVLTCTSSILGCVFPANSAGRASYKLARLYVAFFISGITHMGGDVMATGKMCFKSFTFFMLQPLGITIEIIVCYLWLQVQRDESNPQKTTTNGGTENIDGAQEKPHNGNIPNTNTDSKPIARNPIPPLWIRCVGSVWLALWMVWTAAYIADPLYSARLSATPGLIRA